ncbi:DNA-3-methyladenine glycosylase I [Arachidicoccus ginsenosidivorans]|jgi:DNA-3-methyladenine glycosylase I|uniref:DNA-3-methyladenine glycosylase I n=1 Tax=Arachidicoccus ginsenosidivorans TaxID=496057 RepID=A0A5B8VNP2_9BACT|nr:DNA-3-methyladenine glycosylase I [Arachidicoccus ginsenosidivorans]QEC73227.1 DNA-3-methyladenine glycosylase I [Arachidicoccus ginsenosidivorans]
MSYCTFVHDITAQKDLIHKIYHDQFYGFPLEDDNQLFGRLILEINQAGLSWATILRKESAFKKAFHNYDIKKIARYADKDIQRLLLDEGIIRNRLKIQAVIHNAKVILDLQKSHGSFKAWLDSHHPLEKADWVKLFKKTFKFTGGEITGEFLMSTGYLPGAHDPDCPTYKKLKKLKNLPLNKI